MFDYSVADWQRQRHDEVGLCKTYWPLVVGVGYGACRCRTIRYDTIGEFNVDWKAEYSALFSTRKTIEHCEEWRRRLHSFSHSWLADLSGLWTREWGLLDATGWLSSDDCWRTLTCFCCCCARISAFTYTRRLFIHWIRNNICKFQRFILFKYQKNRKIIKIFD